MKENLLNNWHFMRWLRLAFGLYAGFHAIQSHSALSAFISVFFLFQAFTNTGCGGSGNCELPANKKQIDNKEIL